MLGIMGGSSCTLAVEVVRCDRYRWYSLLPSLFIPCWLVPKLHIDPFFDKALIFNTLRVVTASAPARAHTQINGMWLLNFTQARREAEEKARAQLAEAIQARSRVRVRCVNGRVSVGEGTKAMPVWT